MVTPVKEAANRFMDACTKWAKLLIEEAIDHAEKGHVIQQSVSLPEFAENLPEAQREVWLAGYQLLYDIYAIRVAEINAIKPVGGA